MLVAVLNSPVVHAVHVAAVSVPNEHELGRFFVNPKPSVHVGRQVDPEATLDVHAPLPPLAGGVLASQGAGAQGLNVFV